MNEFNLSRFAGQKLEEKSKLKLSTGSETLNQINNLKTAKRITFIQTVPFELIGFQSLVANLKEHEIQVIITHIDSRKKVFKKIRKFKPEFICFTACTGDHVRLLELASELKKVSNASFIWGGPHSTFFPEIIKKQGVDVVVRGEAEYILPSLISNPKDTTVKSCWFKTKDNTIIKNEMGRLVANLDDLPYPDMKLYQRFYKSMPSSSLNIVAGRGCPFNCSFCYNQLLKQLFNKDLKEGHYIRMRSPENVLKQIEDYIKTEGKPRYVHFRDDTFIFNRKWIMKFLDLYQTRIYEKYKIQFTCTGRADLVDEEIIKKLKSAGICLFFWAIESGSERVRMDICNKGIKNDRILKCAEVLNNYKIPFRPYNMMGLPTETLEDSLQTVKINQQVKNKYPVATIYDPYPNTDLANRFGEEYFKQPLSQDAYSKTQYDDSLVKCDPRILRLQKLFFYFVKFPRMNKFLLKWIEKDHSLINKFMFYVGYSYVIYHTYKYTIKEMIQIAFLSFIPLINFRSKK